MSSGPSINYATSSTPRPRRGGHALLHEPNGLRIVHGPTGWGWAQSLIVVALTAIPIVNFMMAYAALHSRRPGTDWFALFMIAMGVVFSAVAIIGWVYANLSSKLVTELRVGSKHVTRMVSNSKKMDLWPRESVAGFAVVINPKNRYAALCLGTRDDKSPTLINWLTQADAHALAAACNAELAKPVPAELLTSADDHVLPQNVPGA